MATLPQILIPHSSALRRILNRHPKSSLLSIIEEWFRSPETRPQKNQHDDDDATDEEEQNADEDVTFEKYELLKESTKKKITDRIIEKDWRNGLSHLQVAQLEMKYLQEHSTLKNWNALKVTWDGSSTSLTSIPSHTFQTQLSTFLTPFFKHHIYASLHSETQNLWVRIAIYDDVPMTSLPPSNSIVYLVHFTNSEWVMMGGSVRAEIKDYIIQGVAKVFGAKNLLEHALATHSLTTLSQLLLNQHSQGSLASYRLNQVDLNPLDPKARRKKIKLDDGVGEGYVDAAERERIVPEDWEVVKGREEVVEGVFGKNVLPKMEKIDIRLSVPINIVPPDSIVVASSTSPDEEEIEDITLKIRFEGSNVLEGIKKMIPLAIATAPLPSWLGDLHSMGVSRILVGEEGVIGMGE